MGPPTRSLACAGRRRWLVHTASVAGLAALALGRCGTASGALSPSGYTVSLAQMQALLTKRFPQRYPLAGLAELELRAPALTLLPEINRLRARLAAVVSSARMATPREGALDIEFSLRYAAEDRSLRAHDIAFQSLEIPGLDAGAVALLQFWGPRLARRSLREVVLHRLQEKDTALLEGLGLQPGAITVTPKGLSIAFERRASGIAPEAPVEAFR